MNFKKLKESKEFIRKFNDMDIVKVVYAFNEYSDQNVPVHLALDYFMYGEHEGEHYEERTNLSFLTSNFLEESGYKTLYQIEDEKKLNYFWVCAEYSSGKDNGIISNLVTTKEPIFNEKDVCETFKENIDIQNVKLIITNFYKFNNKEEAMLFKK